MAEDSSSKLDNLNKDDLIKLVKKYIVLQKHLKVRNEDLTNKLNEYENGKTNPSSIDSNQKSDNSSSKELLEDLKCKNTDLINENLQLKEQIDNLSKQNESLAQNIQELNIQLDNSRHEIELNKSMLDMLNNEIKILNNEKLQIEKKLLNTRRNTTPSVIVEEDEEDLEEEKRNDQIYYLSRSKKSLSNGISDENLASQMNSNSVENINNILSLNKDSAGSTDTILAKQLEDMTFYIDELKSELEAEKEKNNDYLNEIKSYQKQIEEFEEQHNSLSKELESKTTELNKMIEKSTPTNEENISANVVQTSIDTDKFYNYLINLKEKLIEFDTNTSIDYSSVVEIINEERILNISKEIVDSIRASLSKKNNRIDEESNRVKYVENQMERVIKEFKQEIDNLETRLNDKIHEFSEYKSQTETKIKSLQTEVETEREKYKEFRIKQEKLEKEQSKNKMLDLEMADYERSIKSLNVQLISKDKEINDLKNELNSGNEKIAKFKSDLEAAEKERDEDKEKTTKLKQLLVKAKKDVSEAKAHEAEHLANEASMKAQLEGCHLEIENYKLQLVELTTDRQRLTDKLNTSNELHQRNLQLFETKNRSLEESLNELRNKLEILQTEYDNYKIKVQHAFKKQKEQSETSVLVANTNETQKYLADIEELNLIISKLNTSLNESQEKIKLLEKENELVQEEYARSLDRNTKLLAELKEKESDWKNKNQEMKFDNSNRLNEALETVRNLRIQNEAQVQNYKERIKQMTIQHTQSIDLLQTQLEDTKKEIESLNRQIDELKSRSSSPLGINVSHNGNTNGHSNGTQKQQGSPYSPPIKYDDSKTNFILMGVNGTERQLSEVSETSNGKIPNNSTKTLEQLLSEPSSFSSSSSSIGYSSDSKTIINQMEQLKIDLSKAKLQLEHLNELLNESELNNARLTDQINVLKEEIRRLERNQEREKSISNMEYLKNVVYRFLTFTTPQEKAQLLPVLSTMLKLSQDEQNAIMNTKVTNGSTADGTAAGGWTNYLKWS